MKEYVLIVNGVIKDGPRELPASFRCEDGCSITGFHNLSDEEAKEHGWYQYLKPTPSYDPTTQELVIDDSQFTIDDNAGTITPTYRIEDKTPEPTTYGDPAEVISVFDMKAINLARAIATEDEGM